MGYVQNNLMPGEEVVYSGQVHWAIFMPAFVNFAIGAALLHSKLTDIPATKMFAGMAGAMFILWGLFITLRCAVTKATTELALTSKRIISRRGLIWRDTLDLNYGRVESVAVDQSILGGMLGYGSLVVIGVGSTRAAVHDIKAPQAFRMKAMEMIDAFQSPQRSPK